jgi:hypothetical protein
MPAIFAAVVHITNNHRSHKSCGKYKSENRANKDFWIYQRWDQVLRRSKHPYKHGSLGIPDVGSGA